MGKKKFIDKKNSVTFKLVPAIDKNNEHKILFQYVQNKNTKLSKEEQNKLKIGLSNQKEFNLETIVKKDPQFDGIPEEILAKIRGRSDLVINDKNLMNKLRQQEGDDAVFKIQEQDSLEDVDEQLEQQEIIQKQKEYGSQEDDQQWVDQEFDQDDIEQQQIIQEKPQKQQNKPFIMNEQDFPSLDNQIPTQLIENIQIQTKGLTQNQIKILNAVIPQNYKQMKFQGVQMRKFDQFGIPLDDGYDYSQHYSKATGQVIASMESNYEVAPKLEVDIDIKPEQLNEQAKQVFQCLNNEQGYQPLEDDFFMNLIKSEKVQIEQQKKIKQSQKLQKNKLKKVQKKIQIKQVPQQKPKQTELQITDQMLDQAIQKFEKSQQFQQQKVKFKLQKNQTFQKKQQLKQIIQKTDQIIDPNHPDWSKLSKKQKRQFMKNYIIPQPQDIQKQQLQIKLKSFKNVKPEQIHLRTIFQKLKIEQDLAMQATLNKEIDSQIQFQQSQSEQDDIVSTHTKNSVIFSNLNYVQQENKKKNKKKGDTTINQQLKQVPKFIPEKRKKDETKQQKKLRKQQVKQNKQQRKEMKKKFIQQIKQQKKVIQGNQNALLYKVSRIKIQ